MDIRTLSPQLAVAPQILPSDVAALAAQGFRAIVCHRPDGESADQPNYVEIELAATLQGLQCHHQPVVSGKITDEQAMAFGQLLASLPKPVLAFCRTGTRSATLWALSEAGHLSTADILERTSKVGYDLGAVARRIANGGKTPGDHMDAEHQVLIIGGGAAGIAVASSLMARQANLDIAIIEPADVHYYQPGWTLVGGGVFQPGTTARTMSSVLPKGVQWIKSAVVAFEPERNVVILEGCRVVRYQQLIVCPGLKVDWHGIDGLVETLGRNGVTSNYRYDLAPYTWKLVSEWQGGRAVFTQPPMPIKCAGAPQKAMYLSCDEWRRRGVLAKSSFGFYNAGGVLFGVADYVPALMDYVEAYKIGLNFGHTLTAIDGVKKTATFSRALADGGKESVETEFDMIHVVPPQKAPDFVRVSPLADPAGWVDVDQFSLRHKKFDNIFALGDVSNTPNAKTAAAARKQAPVVAHNVLHQLGAAGAMVSYDGYGSCPLTVERGKIVLAEFLYGGKVAPTFPKWIIDGTRPSRLAWLLKERILPPLYWRAMLRGREWMAEPTPLLGAGLHGK